MASTHRNRPAPAEETDFIDWKLNLESEKYVFTPLIILSVMASLS